MRKVIYYLKIDTYLIQLETFQFIKHLFYFAFSAILGHFMMAPAFVGFLMGYLVYDMSHYAVHHFNWKTAYFQRIKKHHPAKWSTFGSEWDPGFGLQRYSCSGKPPASHNPFKRRNNWICAVSCLGLGFKA